MIRGKAVWVLCLFFAIPGIWGCAQKQHVKFYVLMEKQLADMPKRHRTTAKIVIADIAGSDPIHREKIEKALKEALADIRKDDPELDAALIWAYKNRSELNQTFTLGKLEWSKDKKGWDLPTAPAGQAGGKQNLSQEIITEIR